MNTLAASMAELPVYVQVEFTDAFPYVVNGRTLVLLRILVEKSGAEATRDYDNYVVTIIN